MAANASGSQAKHAGTHLPGLPMTSGLVVENGDVSWPWAPMFMGFSGNSMDFHRI